MEKKLLVVFTISTLFLFAFCISIGNSKLEINTSHLDYLYEEIEVNGNVMAVINIYSNYPTYEYIVDEDEGSACVDDASRAAVFYLKHFEKYKIQKSLERNKKLLKFLIYLQADNGYFYNFIWPNLTINRDFKTSLAEPNWWSWRALWALSESYYYYKEVDTNFSAEIMHSMNKLINAIKSDIPPAYHTEVIDGLKIPAWLPSKYASDQSAVLLLGLINYQKITNDEDILNYIILLTDGIMQMQIKDQSNKYYGAFLSWQNYWHAWGNNQAYALLKSYQLLDRKDILHSALLELDNFYPKILNVGFINSFKVEKIGKEITIHNEEVFSQIAYNIRPMVYALLEANKITKDSSYAYLAGSVAKWFSGNNLSKTKMYNLQNGIVFDGIESVEKVNMNSGAESTIEALISLLEISGNEIAVKTYVTK